MPRTIIVSASDENYAFFVNDLFLSIKAQSFSSSFDLGVLDVGLSENNKKYFPSIGVQTRKPAADIEYPSREHWERQRPGLRALTAKPFIPSYFPGYELYIWLDADVWVQTPEAIETLVVEAAKTPGISLACEFDRAYSAFFDNPHTWQVFRSWYEANFPEHIAATMALKPMLNVGVFAMRGDSPIWKAWADIYGEALQKTTHFDQRSFMAEQLGLNILLYMKGMPCTLLPCDYNWMTGYAMPLLDRATNMYVEPLPPYRPISQLHLTRPKKNAHEKIRCLDGAIIERKLTFSARTD